MVPVGRQLKLCVCACKHKYTHSWCSTNYNKITPLGVSYNVGDVKFELLPLFMFWLIHTMSNVYKPLLSSCPQICQIPPGFYKTGELICYPYLIFVCSAEWEQPLSYITKWCSIHS